MTNNPNDPTKGKQALETIRGVLWTVFNGLLLGIGLILGYLICHNWLHII